MPNETGVIPDSQPLVPNVETVERTKEQKFSLAVDQGIKEALFLIESRFENPDDPESQQDYHRALHTKKRVIAGAKKILTAIREEDPDLVSERDIELGKFAAAFHDTVQNGKVIEVIDKEGRIMLKLKRDIRNNEIASADEAEIFMQKINNEQGEDIFTARDMMIVKESIMLTVPTFDTQKKTVVQPGFAEASIIAKAVALADLGTPGMGNAYASKYDTMALFREENRDFRRDFNLPAEQIPIDTQEWYKKRIVGWCEDQKAFIVGREIQHKEDRRAMPLGMQRAVDKLFINFDTNLQANTNLAEQARSMSYVELVNDFENTLNPNTADLTYS